jgi:hypothetical protein
LYGMTWSSVSPLATADPQPGPGRVYVPRRSDRRAMGRWPKSGKARWLAGALRWRDL